MNNAFNKSYLPVPEIFDSVQEPVLKQKTYTNNILLKPPKLHQKSHETSFNRSLSSATAHAISFRDSSELDEPLLSPLYDHNKSESYFDQCFDVISKIGEGSFGEVFKVRSKENGHLSAVKKSKQMFRSERNRQERLEEVKRYEEFSQHEHCVQLYRAWEQDDRLYMEMELCKTSLDRYAAEHNILSENQIWSILLDLLLALKSLHDRNLIHLDIKLDNILISYDDTCKLADFGLVIDSDKANLTKPGEGDSRYIAPELLQGKFSTAADVFSLGIAIFELASNLELPSHGPLWQRLRNSFPEDLLQGYSVEFRKTIKSMMSPYPDERPTVDELLSHKIISTVNKSRQRWSLTKIIRKKTRTVKEYIGAKMCNLQRFFMNIFYTVFTGLRTDVTFSSPKRQHNPFHFSITPEIRLAQESPNMHAFSDTFLNSTPLNHHTGSSRKFRKDLSRIKLNLDAEESPVLKADGTSAISWTHEDKHESSTLICKKLFLEEDSGSD